MIPNNCPFDITPYTQSQNVVTPKIFNLNYTNQDFWSMKTRCIDYVKQNFSDDFSDFIEGSLAIMLIENMAFVADTLSFKADQIANEVFIDTVTETDNAFRLAKLVGFEPLPPIASRSLWTASLNNASAIDVVIPAPYGIDISTGTQQITIELFPADSENNPIFNQDIVIPAGSAVNASIVGLEGKTLVFNGVGSGAVAQIITIPDSPVIYESVQVTVDGVIWDRVDYFTDSQPRREYRVEFDGSWNAFVIFGNNRAGLIPSQGSVIAISYRIGGGAIGNIVSGSVTKQTIINVPGVAYSIPVSFTNYTKGEFGYDGDTIEDIRSKLPSYLRTQNRAVTGLDYKTLSDQFATPYQGKIGKSNAVLRNHGCAGNIVDIYILALESPNVLQTASAELKNSLNMYLNDLKMLTHFICIRDGRIVLVDVNIDAVLNRTYRKFEEELRIKIQRRLDTFFNLTNWEYGQSLRDVDIIKSLSDLKEIDRLEIHFNATNYPIDGTLITTNFFEIIRPGTTEIIFTYQ